jgi:hypothetical protein
MWKFIWFLDNQDVLDRIWSIRYEAHWYPRSFSTDRSFFQRVPTRNSLDTSMLVPTAILDSAPLLLHQGLTCCLTLWHWMLCRFGWIRWV